MAWSGEHRAFVVEQFLKHGESVIATQRSFQRHFSLSHHDPAPTGKTIHQWVSNFRQTSSALKGKVLAVQEPAQDQKVSPLWQLQFGNLPDVPYKNMRLPYTCPIQVSAEFYTDLFICTPTI